MQQKILFINSCIRPQSRTLVLAKHLLSKLNGNVEEIDLSKENITPLDFKALENRTAHTIKGDYSSDELKYAKQFANADIIVIAAPFWDLSFPSILKVYIEAVTVSGITFEYSESGFPITKCRAKKLYYITTAGGYIGNNNYGFDYVKAVGKSFFGIEDICFYSAEGLDILGADVLSIMDNAKSKIDSEI